MKKLLYVSLLLLICCTAVFAQRDEGELPIEAEFVRILDPSFMPDYDALSKIKPYFYCISGNGIPVGQEIYVLGTCHLLGKDGYPDYVYKLLTSTEQLLSERSDDGEGEEDEADPVYIQLSILDELSEITFNQLQELCRQYFDYDEATIQKVWGLIQEERNRIANKEWAPWYQLTTPEEKELLNEYFEDEEDKDVFCIAGDYMVEHLSYEAFLSEGVGASFDNVLPEDFKAANKSSIALDVEILNQLSVIQELADGDLSEEDALGNKKAVLYYLEVINRETTQEVIAGKAAEVCRTITRDHSMPVAEDIPSILEYVNDSEEEDIVTDIRSLAWRNQFEEVLNNGQSAAIVVGGYHLLGEVGVLNSFAQKGYTITHIGNEEDAKPYLEQLGLLSYPQHEEL